MEIAIILSKQIIVMFLLMGVGYFLDKKKLLSQATVKELTNFLLLVVVSGAILNSFQAEHSAELSRNFAYSLILSAAAMLIGISISTALFGTKTLRRKLCIMGSAYSNSSFMAFPLLHATFGDIGIFYGTAYVAMFNLALWSHGVTVMSTDDKKVPFKKRAISIIKTPAIIAVIAGIITYIFNIKFPPIIGDALGYITDLNTPLAMVVIGVFVSRCNLKEIFTDLIILPVVAVKLLLIPIVTIGFLFLVSQFVTLDDTMMLSVLICASSCTASTVVLLSQQYGRNVDFAVRIVTLSTLCCVVTVPLMTAAAKLVL